MMFWYRIESKFESYSLELFLFAVAVILEVKNPDSDKSSI